MRTDKIDLYNEFGIERKGGERGYLYLYAHTPNNEEPKSKKRPALLVIPGGGYVMVSAREGEPEALHWAALGFNCFVLDYSVAPSCYPAQLTEAVMAMKYIRQTARQFATDTEHIAAMGFSAGGHLCAMLSNIASNVDLNMPFDIAELQPQAVVLAYGVLDFNNGKTHMGTFDVVSNNGQIDLNKIDSVRLVSKSTSPAFVWCTRDDGIVPFTNSVNYALALDANGVPFELHIFESGLHGLSLATAETASDVVENHIDVNIAQWVDLAENWLERRGFRIKFNDVE